jgi:hypothetical protein
MGDFCRVIGNAMDVTETDQIWSDVELRLGA